jgi:hypothetical protein
MTRPHLRASQIVVGHRLTLHVVASHLHRFQNKLFGSTKPFNFDFFSYITTFSCFHKSYSDLVSYVNYLDATVLEQITASPMLTYYLIIVCFLFTKSFQKDFFGLIFLMSHWNILSALFHEFSHLFVNLIKFFLLLFKLLFTITSCYCFSVRHIYLFMN